MTKFLFGVRKLRTVILASILSLALVAAACSGDAGDQLEDGEENVVDEDDDDEAPDDGPDDDDVAEPEEEGGGSLTIVTPDVVSNVDSEMYQGFISIDLLPNIAGTLLSFEEPEQGATELQQPEALRGELAESWEESEDGTEVTFTLRDDARSPYGNAVSSEDVEWSVQRMLESEGIPIARILMGIGGWNTDNPIDVIDDQTFVLNLDAPNAVSLSILSTFFMTIYDTEEVLQHATDDDPWAYEWLAENTATFGPYHVASMDPGQEVRLEPNPNYFRGLPEISNVLLRAISESAIRVQLVESGEADIGMGYSFTEIESLEASDAVDVRQVLYPNIDAFAMNVTVEPFDDPRVREALSLAVDRDAIVNASYRGFAEPARDFMHGAFGTPEVDNQIEQDLDRARELLEEAGYPDGFEFEFAYNIGNLGGHSETTAVELESQFSEIGVNARATNIPSGADFDEAKRDGTLAAWLETSLPLVPDPAYYLQVFYATGGLTNQKLYSNDELDDLSRLILETQPGSERDELLVEVNELMISDMPSVPLVDAQKFYAFNPSVRGFRSYPQGHIHYWDLAIE